MLEIVIPVTDECWDEETERFIPGEGITLHLEHSLVSLSKWESKHHKAFLSKREKTAEETLDYIRCMTLDENVPDEVYTRLTQANIDAINQYIEDPMSATHFYDDKNAPQSRETTTAELLYYWMLSNGVPLEWENRHLNRLIALLRMFSLKNSPKKKRSPGEIARRHAEINAANRARYHTRG